MNKTDLAQSSYILSLASAAFGAGHILGVGDAKRTLSIVTEQVPHTGEIGIIIAAILLLLGAGLDYMEGKDE